MISTRKVGEHRGLCTCFNVYYYNVLYIGCCMQLIQQHDKIQDVFTILLQTVDKHTSVRQLFVARINVRLEPLKMKLVAMWILFISGLSIVDNIGDIGAWFALFGFSIMPETKKSPAREWYSEVPRNALHATWLRASLTCKLYGICWKNHWSPCFRTHSGFHQCSRSWNNPRSELYTTHTSSYVLYVFVPLPLAGK